MDGFKAFKCDYGDINIRVKRTKRTTQHESVLPAELPVD